MRNSFSQFSGIFHRLPPDSLTKWTVPTAKCFRFGCTKLLFRDELKINFFQFFRLAEIFHFWFPLQCTTFSRLNFSIFLKAFQQWIFFILQVLRVARHTSSQGESFRSFWDADLGQTLFDCEAKFWLCCCRRCGGEILFSRRSDCTNTTASRSVSLFGFARVCWRRLERCEAVVLYVSCSCMCSYNNARSSLLYGVRVMFSFFRKRIFTVYVFAFSTPPRTSASSPSVNFDREICFTFHCFPALRWSHPWDEF